MDKEVRITQNIPLKDGIGRWFKNHFHPTKRFPFVNTIKNYSLKFIKGDMIAGITVGLLLVPQSLAMADIVKGPSINGLYSSLMGPISSIFFSTCPDSSLGPTVLVSVVAARFNQYESPIFMSILSFFSGIVMIIAGILNAGVIMKLVSSVVISSFMTVGSLTIIISQLPTLFGVKIKGGGAFDSYTLLVEFFSRIDQANLADLAIGVSCIIVCLALHYTLPYLNKVIARTTSKISKIFLEFLWFVVIAKNAILTILMTVIAYYVSISSIGKGPITLTGELRKGFPLPQSPFQSVNITETGEVIPLSKILQTTAPGFFLVSILMFVETLMVVKSFSRQKNYEADVTQEIINVGIGNVLNSFFQGFPIGGSISRSAVNAVSGVKSTLSGIITFFIILLVLVVLTPVFAYIPKASLAGMLIAAVIPNLDFMILRVIWRTKKWEYLPWLATFFIGLYALEFGMMAGIALSASFILFREIRPITHRIHHTDRRTGSYTFRLKSSLRYPGAEFIVEKILSFKKICPDIVQLYIDCHSMQETDVTIAAELYRVILKMRVDQNVTVNLKYVKDGCVRNIFNEMGLGPYIIEHEEVDESNCLHCHKYHIHGNTHLVGGENNLDTVASAPIKYFVTRRRVSADDLVPIIDVEQAVSPNQMIATSNSHDVNVPVSSTTSLTSDSVTSV